MPATLTYNPPPPQNPADVIREDTRDTRRLMNPLAGIMSTHRNALGYRYSSPNGDNLLFGITGNPSGLPHLSVHCSLLTVHWTYTFSAKEKDSETGLSYFGSRYYSSDLSIWLSVDPMASKYPSLSPYVYCANNPVKLVDPDGEEVILIGSHAMAALQNMQQGTNLKLTMGKYGKIKAEGEAVSEADELLLKAINSKSVCAVVVCENEGDAGCYMGSTYNKKNGTAVSVNVVNVQEMQNLERDKNAPIGSGLIHEATEGYFAGEIAISTKHNIKAASRHQAESPEPLNLNNNLQFNITISDTWVEDYPRDYKKYEQAHSSASPAPNEMSPSQKLNYKNPSPRYILNKYFTR